MKKTIVGKNQFVVLMSSELLRNALTIAMFAVAMASRFVTRAQAGAVFETASSALRVELL